MIEQVFMEIKKLENFKGELPKYETYGAAGFDLRAQVPFNEMDGDHATTLPLLPGQRMLIKTGLAVAVQKGFELQIRPRSGLAYNRGISIVNSPGTVDSDYRGEIGIILINHGDTVFIIKDQDRIAQAVLTPVVQASFKEVDDLDKTERGAGGYGSTGI